LLLFRPDGGRVSESSDVAHVRKRLHGGERFRDGIHSPYRIQQEVCRRLGTDLRVPQEEKDIRVGREAVGSQADGASKKKEMTTRLAAALLGAPAVDSDFPPVEDRPDFDQVSAPRGA
jgi:hypothetical protein